MEPPTPSAVGALLEAVAFAARAHRAQLRKDGQTPYVSHVFRVCLVLAHVFGVRDERILTAAVLHDTLEDTTTDHDDVAEKWDPEVARWVALLSKDKRLPYEEREAHYCKALSEAPWQVQLCKLGDLFDNIQDMVHLPASRHTDALRKMRRYLDALRQGLKPEAAAAWDQVARLCEAAAGRLSQPTAAPG